MQTLVFLPLRGARVHIPVREIVIIHDYFFTPLLFFAHLHRLHRLTDFRILWIKRRNSVKSMSFLRCEQKFFDIFHYFSQKYVKFPIPTM